jgi:ferric-dicitrate binding protein FerR (iron transport regulator)
MQQSEEYIHALITRKLAGEASPEETLYLEELMSANQTVRDQYRQVESIFSPEDLNNHFIRYENWNWADAGELASRPPKSTVFKNIWKKGLAVAALIAGIAAGIHYYKAWNTEPEIIRTEKAIALQLANGTTITLPSSRNNIQLDDAKLNNSNKTLTYSTASNTIPTNSSLNSLIVPTGMDYHVVLSDGTEIWLNSATRLQFPFTFTGNSREITINGEAYMKVAKNDQKPFIVHVNREGINASIQVLGTSFNINTYDSSVMRVSLVEGAIRFKSAGKDISIKPGTEAVYTAGQGVCTRKFDADEVLAWQEGKYYFTEATLQDIVAVLPRWYGVDVAIDDRDMRDERFTGVINRNKPITVFLDKLKKIMKIDYYFDNAGVLHFK